MSIIQRIREKGALISAIVISISLLGFILMDAFSSRASMFSGGPGNTIGKVNGEKIDRIKFQQDIQMLESRYAAQGAQLTDEMRRGIMQQTWEQSVENIVMNEEFAELGLEVTEKELRDILYGENPPEDLKQRFTDPETGQFNAVSAMQSVNQALKDPSQKAQLENYFEALKNQRKLTKYMNLLANTVNFPKWFLEKRNTDNSLMAKFSYVSIPYASIPDSTVQVTDAEIRAYMKEHEDDFIQKEETRSINYVMFSAAPTSADSAAIKSELESLIQPFEESTDPVAFLNQNGSILSFFDGFLSENAIQVSAKDSILQLPDGGVYGPYLDLNQQAGTGLYVIAKKIASRNLPDSVKCRHILLGTVNPQTGQPLMADSVAKAKADSIAAAIAGGAHFDTLETKYTTDQVAHQDKGVMTFSSTTIQDEQFAKEFGQFILFDGKPGDKKVLKTQFGWHYIEIMDHINVNPHHKVAYMGRQIIASPETDQEAVNKATMFAGESTDIDSFNENAEKLKSQGINKFPASGLKEMDFNIAGVQGNARTLVKMIFEADREDVISPQRVDDNYIVAVVTDVNEPGEVSVSQARTTVAPVLMNRKKAEQIIKNIGPVTTLEAVASKTGQQVQTLDSVRFTQNVLSFEPKVIGAVFNDANKGKVVTEPIGGTQGVYVIRVENRMTVPVEMANIDEQKKMMESNARQSLMQGLQQGYNPVVETLKSAADIKDNRSEFY